MDEKMLEKHTKMKEMMSQMSDMMTEMQGVMSEVMGEGEMPKDENEEEVMMNAKNKRKDEYLAKPQEQREVMDEKEVMGKKHKGM